MRCPAAVVLATWALAGCDLPAAQNADASVASDASGAGGAGGASAGGSGGGVQGGAGGSGGAAQGGSAQGGSAQGGSGGEPPACEPDCPPGQDRVGDACEPAVQVRGCGFTNELDARAVRTLCEWTVRVGQDVETCPAGSNITFAASVAECEGANDTAHCPVADALACLQALRDDPCAYPTDAACQRYGKCVFGLPECAADTDCPTGASCAAGACQGGEDRIGCPAGEVCDGWACQPPACAPAPGCPEGQVMDASGECCPADNQCPPGQRAENGACVHDPEPSACGLTRDLDEAARRGLCEWFQGMARAWAGEPDCPPVAGLTVWPPRTPDTCEGLPPFTGACPLADVVACYQATAEDLCGAQTTPVCRRMAACAFTGGNCMDDSSCESGERCVNNLCTGGDRGRCPAGETCDGWTCRETCPPLPPCPEGQVRDRAGDCQTPPPPPACAPDRPCADGRVCRAGACEDCERDAECPVGRLCGADGACVACAEDRECGLARRCEAGACVADPQAHLCGTADQLDDAERQSLRAWYRETTRPACVVPGAGDVALTDSVGRPCPLEDFAQCVRDRNPPGGDACGPVSPACARLSACLAGQPVCQTDAGCPAGARCVNGACEGHDPAACPAHQACVDRTCRPLPPECAGDGDCAAGDRCVQGFCEPRPPVCDRDQVDAARRCPDQQACVEGACEPCTHSSQCPGGFVCDAGACRVDPHAPTCGTTAAPPAIAGEKPLWRWLATAFPPDPACGLIARAQAESRALGRDCDVSTLVACLTDLSRRCDANTPACARMVSCNYGIPCAGPHCGPASEPPTCPEGQACEGNLCRVPPDGCAVDADCDAGERCEAGACRRPPACDANRPCPAGEYCVNGECGPCTHASDCRPGEMCVSGTCESDPQAQMCGTSEGLSLWAFQGLLRWAENALTRDGSVDFQDFRSARLFLLPDGLIQGERWFVTDLSCPLEDWGGCVRDIAAGTASLSGPGACLRRFRCVSGDLRCEDALCPAGTRCEGNHCVGPNYPPSCPEGRACVEGFCAPPPPDCDADADCDRGERCVSRVCTHPVPVCGNGTLEAPDEACDDGNVVAGDGCGADCQVEYGCAYLEALTDAQRRTFCEFVVQSQGGPGQTDCGGGRIADVFTVDRCLALLPQDLGIGLGQCRVEVALECFGAKAGDACARPPECDAFAACYAGQRSPPCPRCGDGLLQTPAEQCDDGNEGDGDGCSADCAFEFADACTQDLTVPQYDALAAFEVSSLGGEGRRYDCGQGPLQVPAPGILSAAYQFAGLDPQGLGCDVATIVACREAQRGDPCAHPPACAAMARCRDRNPPSPACQ
jgi:cysteine-rich repeat protein